MQATLALQQRAIGASTRAACRRRPASRRLCVPVRAHDDDDVLPIWSGRMPEAPDPAKLKRSALLGGKTLAEELALMQEEFTKDERATVSDMEKHLYSNNWQGDVYVGSSWNMLTLIMGLIFFVPIAGLLFAYLSYGTLWTGHYYGI